MKKKRSKFLGSHITRVIGSTQETYPSRNKEIEKWNVHYVHANDSWKDAPLTRFEALRIMTTKVDKADGTGNFTQIEAVREFSKWKEEGNFREQARTTQSNFVNYEPIFF